MKKLILPIILLLSINTLAEEVDSIVKIKKETPFYIGASVNINKDVFDYYSLSAGYNLNKYLGFETRFLKNNDSKNIFNEDISVFIKPQYGIYDFNVYSLFGYSKLNLKDTYFSTSEYSFKWGVGMEYDLKESIDMPVNIYIDYTDIIEDKDKFNIFQGDADTNTLNIGITYKF